MTTISAGGWLWRNAAVAAAYVALGLVAGQLAGPVPGLLVLSPGAGVALAAALYGGWRLLPGIALGSSALGLLHFGLPTVAPALVSPAGLLLVSAAVTLQAWLAATLARRHAGLAVADDQPWSEVHALFYGSLCCGISALARALLVGNGEPGAPDVLLALSVAWAGSTAGLLVVAPLVLAVVHRRHTLWRDRLVNTLLPSLLALAAVILIALQVNEHEKQRLDNEFSRQTHEVDAAFRQQFVVYRRLVLSINRYWQSSAEVQRDEFRRFVTPLLEEFPALQALEWVPYVTDSGRAAFEANAHRDGLLDFSIRERSTEDPQQQVPAARRDHYLPVYYVEPLAGNENVLGFDIASLPDRAAFLAAAGQRRAPTGSPPLTLIQDARENNGLLVIQPVHLADSSTLLGHAVAVFHIDAMLHDTVQAAVRARLTLAITDITTSPPLPVLAMPDFRAARSTFQTSYSFDFDGRQWRIDYRSTPAFHAAAGTLRPWLTLTGGCLLVGLLQALLLALSGQTRRTAREVELRTRELRGLAALSEALQGAKTVEDAHGVMAARVPELFPGLAGGLSVLPADNSQPQALVQWGGANDHARTDIPLDGADGRLGLLWLQAEAGGNGVTDLAHAREVAQTIKLALGNLRLRDALRDQAIRDALTGLYNRRYLAEAFPQALANARRQGLPLCVAQMDIDHFKRVNDTYGHDAGDRVLQALAFYLRSNLRGSDLCFRLGGEEFALLLPNTALAEGVTVVDKLRAGFATQEFHFGEHPVYRPTFSAGVSEAPRQGDRLDVLLNLADDALYRAKEGGRNRVLPAGEEPG